MSYTISVPAFDGPLDLLLHLIDRQELDITSISLAQVTDQYLRQVELLEQDKIPELIDFVVVGARLLLIKSRALLPQPPISPDGEEEEDPGIALVRQLQLYRRFKSAAEFLKQRETAGLRTYLRVAPPLRVEGKLDLDGVTAGVLVNAMLEVMDRYALREDSLSVAQPRVITIEEQIERLRLTARHRRRFRFHELFTPEATRVELAVTLLALLEMIKRREVSVSQPTLFGPVDIARTEIE